MARFFIDRPVFAMVAPSFPADVAYDVVVDNTVFVTESLQDEVQGPVIAIALVLASVFVPVAFLGGIVGQLYRQFALTVAVSVMLSALVALTLTPALCALLLEPRAEGRRPGPLARLGARFNRAFAWTTERYGRAVALAIRHALVVVAALAVLSVGSVGLMGAVPGGFVPEAASLVRTRDAAAQVDEAIRGIPGVARTITVSGANILTGAGQSSSASPSGSPAAQGAGGRRGPGRPVALEVVPMAHRMQTPAVGQVRSP